MRYAYPASLAPDKAGFTISFPDVPDAHTRGNTRAVALAMGRDALATALASYVHARRDLPTPSAAAKGQVLVSVPPVIAAKLALYRAMRAQDVTQAALAQRLGVTENAVRKLLNPDHRSHIGNVEAALAQLGRNLVVEDRAA